MRERNNAKPTDAHALRTHGSRGPASAVAPPAYRPQPTPKCLQMKAAPALKRHEAPTPRNTNATALRPQTTRAGVAQLKAEPKRAAATPARPRQAAPPAIVRPKPSGVVQPKRSGVVQATKFYPNLHPGAVERVEPNSLFRLENFTDQYRLRRVGSHGAYVPNQQYNFVRTGAGEMLLHNRYRHPSIAEGRHVLYAGEVFFNNGKLEWWSNGSGHYQPDSQDAVQAALPMENFYTYQQVIKGEHKRRNERRG